MLKGQSLEEMEVSFLPSLLGGGISHPRLLLMLRGGRPSQDRLPVCCALWKVQLTSHLFQEACCDACLQFFFFNSVVTGKYVCFVSTASFCYDPIWGPGSRWPTPCPGAESSPSPQWSSLFFPRHSRLGPSFLSPGWGCCPPTQSPALHSCSAAICPMTVTRVVFLTPTWILPWHLAEHTSPGLYGPVPGHFSSFLSPTPDPAFVYTAVSWTAHLTLFIWRTPTLFFTMQPKVTSSVTPSWVTALPQTQTNSVLPFPVPSTAVLTKHSPCVLLPAGLSSHHGALSLEHWASSHSFD